MSDGSQLKQNWYSSLNDAEAYFRRLLTSSGSEWRRLNVPDSSKKGKARATLVPEVSDVIVHRNLKKNGGQDIYRLVLEVPTTEEEVVNLEPWKAVLTTPELRQEWDPAVEDAHLLENFDHSTRISKTNFSLGWPANPRDAVTISRSFSDPATVLDISTSLPRSVDEPAYLRPSPPFVRSHVHLFAWCIQHLQSQQKIRITCFWQHDFKAIWGLGSSNATLAQQLSTMVLSLFKTVLKRGGRVPKLTSYGNGVSIERVRFQMDREALTIDYAIIPDDDNHSEQQDLDVIREQRRLTRSIECLLPSLEGWEVQISLKASSEEVEQLPWSANAIKTNSNPAIPSAAEHILLRFTHAALLDDHSVLKVKVVIEASGGTRGLRLNGLPKRVHDSEQRDPSSQRIPQQILQDVASAVDLSVRTVSSVSTSGSSISSGSSLQTLMKPVVERSALAEKSLLSRVRRNYIYFSSLLQEPEAKWRRTTEGRGVAITQLDSIDPTLVVYRAEATFVGVGLWDLYSAVVSPGARPYWDKQFEDGVLLEDVNELSELWYFKSKPAWPVHGRDSVVLKTVYKSPNVIHVFAFSADDPNLFSNIPAVDPNTIRTQVDLQGWSIEALSPTTTSLTLLEQSDPKGWTNKTSLPQYMISTLAGIGEFAIKCGGPPLVTRLTGAKANTVRYDHEKGSFRVEYEASARRRAASSEANPQDDSSRPSIECEIRCDVDTWASSLDIVVDPPPQTMTCLRRHRLSSDGGGLWLTLTHDCVFVDDERLLVLIRRAPGKEKGLVMVNGAKVPVDVEEIPEAELKALSKQKRVKPPRVPLDQPPVVGNVRKRRAEWSDDGAAESQEAQKNSTSSTWASAPRISSPLTRLFSYAVDQATTTTQQYVAAITPANSTGSSAPSATKFPFQHVLEALAWTQEFQKTPSCHSSSPTDGWNVLNVNEKGVSVLRKSIPEVSPVIPVHKGSKVIEGASAEELASIISNDSCRKIWDDRFDSSRTLESYGASCRTQFLTAKAGFPFRDRGFYLASLVARTQPPSLYGPPISRRNTNDIADQAKNVNAVFVVSSSFSPESITPLFTASKYNVYGLPIGRVYLDAWILETLDPYSTENYAIPSTRCTRLVALDYAGSIPAAVNSMINTGLPRAIMAVESCFKAMSSSLPLTRLPASCLLLAEKKGEDRLATASWKLKTRDHSRRLLDESYYTEPKIYRTSLLVTMESKATVLERGVRSKSPVSRNGAPSSMQVPQVSSPSTTPRPPDRPFSPPPPSSPRIREASEATITERSSRSRSSSASSSNADLRASIETLKTARAPETPFYAMPGTISIPKNLGSPGESLVRPFRQRAASSTDGGRSGQVGYHAQYATSPGGSNSVSTSPPVHSLVRGRAASSVFTGKGEIKPLKDFVVGEVVIDTRLYPQGYTVLVTSRLPKPPKRSENGETSAAERVKEICLEVEGQDKGKGREVPGKAVFLKLGSLKVDPALATATSTPTASLRAPSPISKSASSDSHKSTDSNVTMIVELPKPVEEPKEPLPISYTIYTMPSSPLHSSSLNPEGGTTRHLLRMTLPTAQYWSSSVRDPLTGQVRQGPKKPAWMKVLEGTLEEGDEAKEGSTEGPSMKRMKGYVVDIEVRPVIAEGAKGGDKDKKRKLRKVIVNGVTVSVVGERESLSSLGRDELLNEQVERMGILSRVPNETEVLPEELIHPIAIADDILDPSVWDGNTSTFGSSANSASLISNALDATSPDSLLHANDKSGQSGGNSAGEVTPGSAAGGLASSITSPSGNTSSSTSSGIWGSLWSYRFGFGGSTTASSDSKTRGLADEESPERPSGEIQEDSAEGDQSGATAPLDKAGEPLPEQQAEQALPARRAVLQQQYPFSTLLAVALIAFLIGSLLRSLLSPADFVYVAHEADEAERVKLSGGDGWREMKRLFELKYILGGWDLQVAAIRRHPL